MYKIMETLPAEILDKIFGYVCIPDPIVNKHIYSSTKYSFLSSPKAINIIDNNFYNIICKCFENLEEINNSFVNMFEPDALKMYPCKEPLFFRKVISCILDNIEWETIRCKKDIYTCITDDITFSKLLTTSIESVYIIESEINKKQFEYCGECISRDELDEWSRITRFGPEEFSYEVREKYYQMKRMGLLIEDEYQQHIYDNLWSPPDSPI